MLYTSEGVSILSYDIATSTQNPDFFTGLPGSNAYAHRTLSTGQFTGDDLVADSGLAALVAMNGPILQMYNLPGNSGIDFALKPRPDWDCLLDGRFSFGRSVGG